MAEQPKFELVKPSPFDEDERIGKDEYEERFCRCEKPEITLEIDCGSVGLQCATCKKPLDNWYLDTVCMDPIRVAVTIEPDHCTCNFMEQSVCDCDRWAIVKPVTEGEG
jgi:hypothetical protein